MRNRWKFGIIKVIESSLKNFEKFKILWKKSKWPSSNAISETLRDGAKRTEIWDHMGKKCQILIIPQTSFSEDKTWGPCGSTAQIFYLKLPLTPCGNLLFQKTKSEDPRGSPATIYWIAFILYTHLSEGFFWFRFYYYCKC